MRACVSSWGLCFRVSVKDRVNRDASDAISAQVPNRRRTSLAARFVCRDENSRCDGISGRGLLCGAPVGADLRARPSIWRQQVDVHDSRVDAAAPLACRPCLDCLDASRDNRRGASKLGRPEHHGDTAVTVAGLVAPNTLRRGQRGRAKRAAVTVRSRRVQRPLCRLQLGSGRSAPPGDGPHGHARQACDLSLQAVRHAPRLCSGRYPAVLTECYFQVTALPSLLTGRYTWQTMRGIMPHP